MQESRMDMSTTTMHMCVILLLIVGTEGRGRLPLSDVAYQTIFKRLRGEYNKPVVERTREEKNALQMLWRNPTRFTIENNKLMFDGKIAARKQDVDQCVYTGFEQTKGAGARKIRKYLAESCSGISEARIYRSLYKSPSYAEGRATFSNRPMSQIKASEIQEIHQVDLVDLHPQEVGYNGMKYRYILIVIDVFSCFLWTRALPNKKSSRIAKALAEIYYEHGPPKMVQRDRGKEIEGAVVKLMKKLNVKIIRTRPYRPKSQGKADTSHRTLRRKIFFDLFKVRRKLKAFVNRSGSNWVENLQHYTQIINSEVKQKLSYKSSFEIYFGRSNNLLKNPLDGEKPDDEENCTFIAERPTLADLKASLESTDNIRKTAEVASDRIHERTSLYNVGDEVDVRIPVPRYTLDQRHHIAEATILKSKRKSGMYRLQYERNGIPACDWFHINDIASRIIAEENARAKMDITEEVPPLFDVHHYTTSGMESLLARFGLGVQLNPSGDGNCQFHALVDQLATLGIHRSSQGLRAELVSDIELNPYLVDGSPIEPFVGSVEAYTQMMSLPGTYGDHVTLQRTAQLFNVQIIVVSSLGATAARLISPSGSYDESLPTLFLGHLAEGHGEHYLSLIPSDESYRCVLELLQDCTSFKIRENRHRTPAEGGDRNGQRLNGIGQNRDECVGNESLLTGVVKSELCYGTG